MVKLDKATGAPLWAKAFGATGPDYAHDVVVDGAGTTYVAGIRNAWQPDAIVQAFTPAGMPYAPLVFASPQSERLDAIGIGAGRLVVAGAHRGGVDFGTGALATAGLSDGVVAVLPNSSKVAHRAISRIGKFGGDRETERSKQYAGKWKEHGPDPRRLMGARTTAPANGGADWTCVQEKHWLFAGTGMRKGDAIPGLVGWEHHGEPADLPNLEVVARGPVFSGGRPRNVEYTAVVFPGPKENVIFNAATIWWADGLSEPPGYIRPSSHGNTPKGPDERVQKITTNLFQRFLG